MQLNGQPCAEPWRHLTLGDSITVDFDPGQRYAAKRKPPRYLGFSILFEDDSILVVDKPAPWLTVPSGAGERDTLVQRIEAYVTRQNRGRVTRLSAAHRLDRGVSGLLVFGKTPAACGELRRQFAERTPDRLYVAIVAGVMSDDAGEFRSYLTTDDELIRHSTTDPDAGELAVTRYSVVRRLADATLVRIELDTGRRNQIRVQFAEAGHPVLGDPRYGRERSRREKWPESRLALHAESLSFAHPVDGRILSFELPWPEEFTRFLGAA